MRRVATRPSAPPARAWRARTSRRVRGSGAPRVRLVSAATRSTTPEPTASSRPAGGRRAVAVMRSMTSRALRPGWCSRISAASPATSGAAKLVPSSGGPVPPSAVNERTSVPGAATSTHGPGIVNRAGRSSGPTAPTVSTSSSQPGRDTRSGRSAAHPPLSRLPAAATTTTSAAAAARSADCTAAPSTAARSAGRHTAPEMFTTVAPASTDRRTAAAREPRSPAGRPSAPPTVGLNCRTARIRASGATPTKPSRGSAAAPISPATAVPWPSQSSSPVPPARASPSPTSRPASRGCGATPVSITAIRCPRPVATACAAGRRSRSAGPGPARSATAAGGTHLTDDAPGAGTGASKASIATTAATPLTVRGPGRRRLRPQVPAGPRRR